METYGLEPQRFKLVWCSSAEAERFAASMREMTEVARELGPSPYRVDAAEQEEVA